MVSRETQNRQAIEYNRAIVPVLRDITLPLFNAMGLTHFTYARYQDGNRFLNLSLDLNLVEGFLGTNLDNYVLWEGVDFPSYTKRIVIWDAYQPHELTFYMRHHGYDHGISLFYRHENDIEAWHFATNRGNFSINNLYTNHIDIIDRFIPYFQERAKGVLSQNDPDCMAEFHDGRHLDLSQYDKSNAIALSKSCLHEVMETKKFFFNYDNREHVLSYMEFQCLKGLVVGKTAKMIALDLNISHRTVESLIDRIRCKTLSYSKAQLIDMYQKSIYSQLAG